MYQRDGLGPVRAWTAGAGALTDTRDVDPFGLPTRAQGTSSQPFGYTGEQRDAETGFVYLRARYYDPGLERFLQRDPLAGRLTRRKSDPDAQALAEMIIADVNSGQYHGEQFNIIGYSGGATAAINAAEILAEQGYGIDNLVTIGGFSVEPPPENVVDWTRVQGQYDELAAVPGFPDHNVTVPGLHHEDYFTEQNIENTVDIVQDVAGSSKSAEG